MTEEQFRIWLNYHCERFPTLTARVNEHKGTRKIWADLLKAVTIDEARAVTDQMASGEIDRPHNLDWDRLPAMIVSEVRSARRYAAIQRENEENKRGYVGVQRMIDEDPHMHEAFVEYLRLQSKGHEHADCRCASRTMLGVATPEEAQRYEAIR